MQRLSKQDERNAIRDFVDYNYPDGNVPEGYLEGCEVNYLDDEDTGKSFYEVIDAQGWGDGSGEWTPVE